jgi:hypothetical protein
MKRGGAKRVFRKEGRAFAPPRFSLAGKPGEIDWGEIKNKMEVI